VTSCGYVRAMRKWNKSSAIRRSVRYAETRAFEDGKLYKESPGNGTNGSALIEGEALVVRRTRCYVDGTPMTDSLIYSPFFYSGGREVGCARTCVGCPFRLVHPWMHPSSCTRLRATERDWWILGTRPHSRPIPVFRRTRRSIDQIDSLYASAL